MKRILNFILLLALGVQVNADLIDRQLYDTTTGDQAKVSTTATNGVHVPHVIVDSGGAGGSGGDASAANQASQITLETAINGKLPSSLGIKSSALSLSIAPSSDGVWPVTGTFWQSIQPISGSLTNISGTISLPTGAATSANQTTANTSLSSIDGKLQSAADTAPATQNITAADVASTTTTGYNSQSFVTGAPTANSTASFVLSSLETINVEVTNTWVGTLISEVSFDGGTFWFTRGFHQAGTPLTASSFTANASGNLNVAGVTNYRIRCTAYTSGTATVRIAGSVNQNTVYIANNLKILDGTTGSTNTLTIKGASTAAVATDNSAVFQLNPNQPVLTNGLKIGDGTNTIDIATSGADNVSNTGNRLRVQSTLYGYDGSTNDRLRSGFTADTGSADGYLNVLPATGTTAGASMVHSTAYEASHVLKNAAGTLVSLVGYNSKASAQFIELFDSTSVPADTAVPVLTFTVPASSNFSVDVPITGLPFGTGISVSNSSTGPTKTLGSADCFFTAVVK